MELLEVTTIMLGVARVMVSEPTLAVPQVPMGKLRRIR
jgi:hypothetical protein